MRRGPSLYPVSLSVVRPGEAVQIVLRDATKVRGEAHAFALGCEEAVSQFTLDATVTSWTIDLEPGAYKLELFAEFEAPGKGGDTSSTLGLQIDAAAEPAIMPAPNPVPACSAGQSR